MTISRFFCSTVEAISKFRPGYVYGFSSIVDGCSRFECRVLSRDKKCFEYFIEKVDFFEFL